MASAISFLAANPRDMQTALRQSEEVERLRDALARSPLARRVEIIPHLTARVEHLITVCRDERPEVFHFSGFEASEDGGIRLEDDEGYSHPVTTDDLSACFAAHQFTPRLVMLSACNTSSTGEALAQSADACISFRSVVLDDYCNTFSEVLYQQLFVGTPIGPAFNAAVSAAIASKGILDAIRAYEMDETPAQLHLKSGVDPATHLVFTAKPMSVFISYGGPDQAVAEKLDAAFEAEGVQSFVFSLDAPAGQSLQEMMFNAVNTHDWMVLLCSRTSLSRGGVRNEIEEAFRRVSRSGGRNRIVPLTIDDYVFSGIDADNAMLGTRLRDLVIKDLRPVLEDDTHFTTFLKALVQTLLKQL